ncbi:DNA mismatch repair endonuclease MutL [Fusibacter bizertensis]|uniref:DNA mismatch repair protein MutL n=1 Tax=Fusibacter bizertensis TaxID=1488331 RepID=A0ABT6N9E0_9FIRM|nr:DNA mismatch repair endonuclease MutL [Fusibacter bizertensis]MDH8677035.1 DNA mismatch repair endonuclease MutL [Fusibacter bizertensis]
MEDNRILKLDERTASKIAAGEVVERPAMVIKELVENAIDAGATEIIVDIKKGGKSYIKVSDNGRGINYEDLSLVFERHATSKIRSIEDLYATASLGFRGEALASICAVSTVELITLREGENSGRKVQAAGGTIQKISEVGTSKGTTIIVNDLFYNTPARLKFLKSDMAEGRSITELMGFLALSHPEVTIKYSSDDKMIFHTQGKGSLVNAIFAVFDQNMVKGMYEISDRQDKLQLNGFISRFDYTKGTRAQQLLFVNGRYVKSDLIKEVIHMAYKPYMMNNRFPACVLFLEIPPSEIDVNIHPAKTEIKFHDDGLIKQFVFSALKKAFNLYDQVPKVTFKEREVFSMKTAPTQEEKVKQLELQSESTKVTELPKNASQPETVSQSESASQFEATSQSVQPQVNSTKPDENSAKPELNSVKSEYHSEKPAYNSVQNASHNSALNPALNPSHNAAHKSVPKSFDFSTLTNFATATLEEASIVLEQPVPLDVEEGARHTIYDGLQYVGVFNNTYLLYEKDKSLYLIDQHAAHEKILFEAFMAAFESSNVQSQMLLMPEIISLSKIEMTRLNEVKPLLHDMGFMIEAFGDDGVVMREIPSMLSFSQAKDMVASVFENAKEHVDDHFKHQIAEKACKAAIKAHDAIHEDERMALVDSLKGLNSPYTCPHGRPIIISFSLSEIERKFKRIL